MKHLLDLADFETCGVSYLGRPLKLSKYLEAYLVVVDTELITADYLEGLPEALDRLLFLSRHSSVSGRPSLLVHFPGNWTDDASMGGKPRAFSLADPALHKALIMELHDAKERGIISGYTVGIEVTHHGPTIDRACTFIEIGSTISEWKDPHAGRIVAESVVEALRHMHKYNNMEAWMGFGGPHYAPKFYAKIVESPILLSHIAPKYVLDSLDTETIMRAANASLKDISGALLDWKGMKREHRLRILSILQNLGMSYLRI